MRAFLLVLLLLSLHPVFAQVPDEDAPAPHAAVTPDPGLNDDVSIHFVGDAGFTNVRPWKLNALLFNHAGFRQLYTVGFTQAFSMERHVDVENHSMVTGIDVAMAVHWYLSDKHTAHFADGRTVQYRMQGWELMTSWFTFDMIRNEHVDFTAGLGTYWGRLRLDADDKTYANPFIAPMLRSELRLSFWRISMGARVSYRHDLTKDNWKRKDDNMDPLPGYRFREVQYVFYIGLWTTSADQEEYE